MHLLYISTVPGFVGTGVNITDSSDSHGVSSSAGEKRHYTQKKSVISAQKGELEVAIVATLTGKSIYKHILFSSKEFIQSTVFYDVFF